MSQYAVYIYGEASAQAGEEYLGDPGGRRENGVFLYRFGSLDGALEHCGELCRGERTSGVSNSYRARIARSILNNADIAEDFSKTFSARFLKAGASVELTEWVLGAIDEIELFLRARCDMKRAAALAQRDMERKSLVG